MEWVDKISYISRLPGIYALKNKFNDKIYVGSSVSIYSRLNGHISSLKKRKHGNLYLQRSWNKHGNNCFLFAEIELIQDVNCLLEREKYWIAKLRSNVTEFGYNCRDADRNFFKTSAWFERYKLQCLQRLDDIIKKYGFTRPSIHSKNKKEKNDALWIWHRKNAKKNGGYKWFNELQLLVEKYHLYDFFELKDDRLIATSRLKKILIKYCNKSLPSLHSVDEEAKSDANWIRSKRQARQGKIPGWYPILEDIAKAHGLPDLFNITNRKQLALNRLKFIIDNYTICSLPKRNDVNSKRKSDARWIDRTRSAKIGYLSGKKTGTSVWYPELDDLAKEHGFSFLFNVE